jgi:thymidylate synthase ThyX
MTISAKVIEDSISSYGICLTTMECRYPRMVHSEFNTHRVFSRNASSSRAIPVDRLIQDVIDDPAMPVFWGKNKPGMQAIEELTGGEKEAAISKWLKARDDAVANARLLAGSGVHKQLVNRIIESWCHIRVVVTSTEWANFYALRRHPDAQPEMKALADAMWEAKQASKPKLLQPGEWHLPYVLEEEIQAHGGLTDPFGALRKLSAARCARTSYLTHDARKPNVDEDVKLCERLLGSGHMSPFEHQGTPDSKPYYNSIWKYRRNKWKNQHKHGNLVGWIQYRHTLPNESIKDR